ncbi:hypothetical protein CCR94_00685 [Rhodoblastus sphagnicola]|uniref:Uncharacterized protein n=1 Tax=Rhodoblastus sphagnicola TaxID=333368 RepID=A0A2S6NGR2_9HYPH|nr:ABC transporter permease [Rhodoblastus sphagnicola]MBB4201009.1 peptide/nickel transport system permease protein [Rhodoblastus sphagnicola]PPQ33835.1 hypothetical protein CCR94_00685 [Rhodoblastus sphagnicola]
MTNLLTTAGAAPDLSSRWASKLPLQRFALGLAAAVLATAALAAIFPQLLVDQGPYDIDPTNAFSPPSPQAWFGTDQNGRDVFSRVVYGARASLFIGIVAISIALFLGAVLGITAALGGRWLDLTIRRFIDVLYAFPGMVLALVVISVLGVSELTMAIAVGAASAAGYAHIIRAQALIVTRSDYVAAARALGHSPARVLIRTILPNIVRILLPLATLGVGQTIVWATGLSFLGLGAKPPAAEWGAMLSDSRNYVSLAWWLTVFPGAAIAVTALSLTVIGKSLQARVEGGRVG